MALYIDQIPGTAVVSINGVVSDSFGSDPIKGYLVDEFNFGGRAEYSSPEAGMIMNTLASIVKGGTETANRLGAGIPQISLQQVTSTIVTWSQTPNFAFSVPLAFVAIHPRDNVILPFQRLHASIHPKFLSSRVVGGLNGATLMEAPNAYAPGSATNPGGTVSVRIGNWFVTPLLFVITAVEWKASRETMQDTQRPLYSAGTVSFESFRQLERAEVLQFFR